MLDWRRVVTKPEEFSKALVQRGVSAEEAARVLADIESVSKKRIATQQKSDELKSRRNQVSQDVAALMKAQKKDEAQQLIAEGKSLGDQITALDDELRAHESLFAKTLEVIPNLPHESVPVGKSSKDNVVVREWGEKRKFDFDPRPHDEIGELTGLIDFNRAGKTSGSRFTFLVGEFSRLERALINYMFDTHRAKGYQEISPPFIVTAETMYSMGQLPKFREDVYKVENEDKFLIPTAEVPVTAYYLNEILSEEMLPKKYMAQSACFRSEAGSYGKDTKGLIRQHQFQKVELVKFTHPDESLKELEAMVTDAEDILRGLEIPFRTIHLCTGDMGFNSRKTYDIEVWLPGSVFEEQGTTSKGCYREISSCSDCGDFQARRGSVRFKSKNSKGTQFVHTLNGSGLAVGRTLIAVLENYQQADGSIVVPKVLRPYMGGLEKIAAPSAASVAK